MAELNLAVKHGQSVEVARGNFQKAIQQAQLQHPRWIRRVEWSPDGQTALLSGPGYQLTLRVDHENVYAHGQVPLALKLLEGPVRRFVEQTLGSGPIST